ncbi:MAG: hypothetical protein ACF8NJ_07560, partial [Phycisphaerales bacterium JB038]
VLFRSLVAPAVFLSFSKGSSWYYMLPVIGILHALMAGGFGQYLSQLGPGSPAPRWLIAVLRLHAILFLLGAGVALLTILEKERGALLHPATRGFGVAVLTLAGAVAVFALIQHRRHLRRGALLLLASWALIVLGSAGTGITWRLEHRRSEAAFGREIAALAPGEQPLLGCRCEATTFVHYADRRIEMVRYKDLPERLAASPKAYLLTRKSVVAQGAITGDIVAEQVGEHADACLLLTRAGVGDPDADANGEDMGAPQE